MKNGWMLRAGKPVAQPTTADETQTAGAEFEILREEVISRGHELIKDKIQGLDGPGGNGRAHRPYSEPWATRPGFPLTQPRIKAEVKHRSGSIGPNPIRR